MALSNALGTDMATLARRLQDMGRGKDRVLAHITPEEAALLKSRGGRGSINPATGLMEFEPDFAPTEAVTVTAPSYAPAISAPIPIPQQQAPAPAPQPLPTEAVTVSANAAPSSITVPDMPAPAPLSAPQAPAAPVTAAPAASAAPEAVTVHAPPAPAVAAPVPIPRPDEAAAPPPDESLGQKTKDFVSNNSTLLTILGLGGLGFLGAKTAANSGQQAQQLQSNLAGLATPLSAAGNTALSTTQAGGLTPQNQKALEAARPQSMGAVSSQQATEAISTSYANLLNTQLNQALTLLNQADAYLQNAYLQGYQANVANQNNTTTFYTNLAQLAARLTGAGGTTINLGSGQ